jgi:hypothetical protein
MTAIIMIGRLQPDILLDASVFQQDAPRVLVVDPEQWSGFTLRQIASGLVTEAVEDK